MWNRRNKYGNKKVEICGIKFDSKKEGQRYLFLMDAQGKGLISGLERQVKAELIPAITEEYTEHLKTKEKVKTRTVQLAITYICDFRYMRKDGSIVYEDVKSSPESAALDKVFLIKEKLFRYRFGFPIRRVYTATEEI